MPFGLLIPQDSPNPFGGDRAGLVVGVPKVLRDEMKS